MSRPLYDINTARDAEKQPRVIKKSDDDFIRDHEIGLLSLLVRKHPERAREFLARLKASVPKAA